jgi:hypothetical protein
MRGFVDRIEGEIVTLLLGDDESVTTALPIAWLPPGVTEGMVLQLTISVDYAQTDTGKRCIQSLMDELGNEP